MLVLICLLYLILCLILEFTLNMVKSRIKRKIFNEKDENKARIMMLRAYELGHIEGAELRNYALLVQATPMDEIDKKFIEHVKFILDKDKITLL